ncbi:MAG: SMC family ATPase [Dehalococcoidales bacterium]|nr:SMC family ATPase [Dehalococcoidales bacterium]
MLGVVAAGFAAGEFTFAPRSGTITPAMIPLKLQLRNFMSYRDNVPPLLFDGFRVACISGDNGHGKSALLDAITWALWGKARAKSEDELIHHGQTEMEVEFEFELGETRYRVIRKRALRRAGGGVRGVGSVDLQIYGDGTYRSIAGNTMHETQRRLNELLRMEYETFVNSAFILQGKADAFTLKPPAERKKVLASLLGLDAYDAFEDIARERAREREAQRREELAKKSSMEGEAARRPEYEAEAVKVAAELEGLASQLVERENHQATLRAEKHALEQDAARLQEINGQLTGIQHELVESERHIAEYAQRIAECEATLSKRKEVEAGYTRLLSLRQEHEQMNARLGKLVALNERRSALVRKVDEARGHLLAEQKVLLSAIADLERRGQGIPRWQDELAKADARLAQMAELESHQEEKRSLIQSLKYQVDSLRAVNEQIVQDGKRLKEKIDLLDSDGGRCPLCESELGPRGRQSLAEKFQEERLRLRHDYDQNAAAVKDLEAEGKEAQKALGSIQEALQAKVALERTVARLEKSLTDAEDCAAQAKEKGAQAAAVAERIERRDYAQAEQAALAAVEREVAELGYDAGRHEAVRAQLGAYQEYEQLYQQLQIAGSTLERERPLLHGAERLREKWQLQLALQEERRAELVVKLARMQPLAAELAGVEGEINALISRQSDARLRQGRVQQMLNHCRYLEQQCKDLSRTIARLAEEKAIFDDLAVAFGKKGIQAMIIEAAVPELEDEANDMLGRMTDGRMRVKFETQRAAKASDAVIETLDIRIADELGTRSYELFSGGEAFKVNFAIRIALSKLLARRAGARLEMLVVDEGFGTQDAQGRERLVEAINEVCKDFAKVLVITHIEELKDAFPVRVDIVKTAAGSQISIT